jgi:hypothetical protein
MKVHKADTSSVETPWSRHWWPDWEVRHQMMLLLTMILTFDHVYADLMWCYYANTVLVQIKLAVFNTYTKLLFMKFQFLCCYHF